MLQVASHVFLQEIGRGHFHQIHGTDDMDDSQLLNLATRRRRFWCTPDRYEPQPYALKDILEGAPLPQIPVATSVEIKNFQCHTECKISGKVGAKLADIMNLSVELLKSITFQLPLGTIDKKAVSVACLVNALQNRRVQVTHPLVQQCLERKEGISIIIEALYTTADVEISATANFQDIASSQISSKVVPADASFDYDRSRSTKLTVPSGTALVFHCLDLEIDPRNGSLRCAVVEGGFRHHVGYFCCVGDTNDGAAECLEPAEIKTWCALSADVLSNLRSALLCMCKRPALIHDIREQLFDKKAISSDVPEYARWQTELKMAEREMSADDLRPALGLIFETLVSLPDDVLVRLPLLCIQEASALLQALLPQVPHSDDLPSGPDGKTLESSEQCCEIVKVLNLRLLPNGTAQPYQDLPTLDALARGLFILFPLRN